MSSGSRGSSLTDAVSAAAHWTITCQLNYGWKKTNPSLTSGVSSAQRWRQTGQNPLRSIKSSAEPEAALTLQPAAVFTSEPIFGPNKK